MGAFIEERLPLEIDYGSSFGEQYAVDVIETANGNEYRKLIHPFPKLRTDISYNLREQMSVLDDVLDLYHRCYGKYAGFRVRNLADFSTNGYIGAPTAFDQQLKPISAGVYQLRKEYGDGPTIDIGKPERTIFKPVSGTVLVGIRNTETGDHPIAAWTVDTTTGRVTMAANKTRPITGITKGATTTITVGANTFTQGETVHISGVSGMVQINGRRAEILVRTASTIEVSINSASFSDWTADGVVNTQPQSGEAVYGGCEFDIPVRWNSDLTGITWENFETLGTGNMEIVEILNP